MRIRGAFIVFLSITVFSLAIACRGGSSPKSLKVDHPNFSDHAWWEFATRNPSHLSNPQTDTAPLMRRSLFDFGPPPTMHTKPEPPSHPPPPPPPPPSTPTLPPTPRPTMPAFMQRLSLRGIVMSREGQPRFAILADGNKILVAVEHQPLEDNVEIQKIALDRVVLRTRDGSFTREILMESKSKT